MCGSGKRVYRRLTEVPVDPSPTPWNHDTWGFFCDNCMTFFDLMESGKVVTHEPDENGEYWHHYEHKCGEEARYIGYDHSKA
jgi:hypothetical protein